MPACPNCGRPTMRTRDWACQWCGYPLLSRAYKKIDKTFTELQEERYGASRSAAPGPELDVELPPESRPAYEPPPRPPSLEPPPRPQRKSPPPRPEKRPPPVSPPAPGPALKPEAELPPAPEPPPELAAPEPVPPLAARPEPEPLPPPPTPEPLPPPPPPLAPPDLNAVNDGSLLTVDQLDALYKADRLAAHARLANKTILVRGFVEKVFIRDHIDVRYIMLTGVNKKVIWPVRCTFTQENVAAMSRLAEGQEVSIRGKYDSYGRNIIFKDCVLA